MADDPTARIGILCVYFYAHNHSLEELNTCSRQRALLYHLKRLYTNKDHVSYSNDNNHKPNFMLIKICDFAALSTHFPLLDLAQSRSFSKEKQSLVLCFYQ